MVFIVHKLLFNIFFFNDTATTEIYTLSLHDALPIYKNRAGGPQSSLEQAEDADHHQIAQRSEEHTSELQSRRDLVCRLLLEKKKHFATTDYIIISELGR